MGPLQEKMQGSFFISTTSLYHMPLHYLPTFIHTKASTLTFPSKPSATIPPSPTFRRLKSFFTVCMKEDSGGIFGNVFLWPWIVGRLLHSPNIVGDFGYRWYHGRKLGKACARGLLNERLFQIQKREVKAYSNSNS